MKLKIILIGLIAFGFATSAMAGSIADDDGDLVPNIFDNCTQVANGTGLTGQADADLDGYGNACDGDLDNNGLVSGSDFGLFIGFFGGNDPVADFDENGLVSGTDFGIFIGMFGAGPGPSGLSCAGTTTPCI